MTGSTSISLLSGGAIELQADTSVNLTAPSGVNVYSTGTTLGTLNASTLDASLLRSDNTTTSDLLLQATGSDLIFQDINAANGTNPRLLFRQLDGTYRDCWHAATHEWVHLFEDLRGKL
jgi:hypothetical protein